jgi:tetratricopeptide (TPR) repeat protein
MPRLGAADRQRLQKALDEYLEVQLFNGDRGGSHFNIGLTYLNLAEYGKAEAAFKQSIRIEPSSEMAYIALADMRRQLNRAAQEKAILDQGIAASPNSGALFHARGLYFVRAKQLPSALPDLKQATIKSPANPRYQYILGVALMGQQPEQAIAAFTKAWQLNSNDLQTLYALTDFLIKRGDREQAGYYLAELKKRSQGAPWLNQLEQAYRQLP